MLFMNEYEVMVSNLTFDTHPVLGPASQTLVNLMEWTNANSDGWAYWPKPCRAAKALQQLLMEAEKDDRTGHAPSVTVADVAKAYRPIKAFLTRQGVDVVTKHEILVDLPEVSA